MAMSRLVRGVMEISSERAFGASTGLQSGTIFGPWDGLRICESIEQSINREPRKDRCSGSAADRLPPNPSGRLPGNGRSRY